MNNYALFTKNATKHQECPILADSATLKDTDHPKQTILIKTGNVMKSFNTLLLWKWVTEGRQTNPLTNLDLSYGDLKRIEFYKESLDRYPDMTLARAKQLVRDMLNNFFQTGECVETSCMDFFADIEDLKPYMFSLPADQPFRQNATQVLSLFADLKYWILRKTSLADSPKEHEHYAISSNTEHYAIRHSFGQGYWLISGNNENREEEFLSPSFMGVLKKLNKSLQDLVCGSLDNEKIQLSIVRDCKI